MTGSSVQETRVRTRTADGGTAGRVRQGQFARSGVASVAGKRGGMRVVGRAVQPQQLVRGEGTGVRFGRAEAPGMCGNGFAGGSVPLEG